MKTAEDAKDAEDFGIKPPVEHARCLRGKAPQREAAR